MRFRPTAGEGCVARSPELIVNEHAPTVDGHPAAITENELDAVAAITDHHDGTLSAPDVPVGFIVLTGSQTAPLEIENVVVHTKIKDSE